MLRAAFLLFPICANAACGPGETLYFACTFSKGTKGLEICHDANLARYTFGSRGTPEMVIEAPVTEVHLTPWPAIGRDVWEEIVFANQGHSYLIAPQIERVYPDDDTAEITAVVTGTIFVEKDGNTLAQLDCDTGSVNFPWDTALFNAKEAKGQCYDPIARQWNTC